MKQDSISIITVVYNSEKFIEATIKSVICQNYSNLEYIIIDGASTDCTMQVVNKYKENISKIISEPDRGLYDAMNKGLNLATGDFVLFLNSGDRLSYSTIISDIFSGSDFSNTGVIYGDTDITDEQGQVLHSRRHRPPESLKAEDFLRGMLVCHQAFIARRNIVSSYDTLYKYAADFDWCINAMKKSQHNHNSHKVIALFMDGGQTKKTIVPGLKERYRIMRKHFGLLRATFWNIVLGIKFGWWMLFHKWF